MLTYTLSTVVRSPEGALLDGATLIAELNKPDYTTDGSVLPQVASARSGESGAVSVDLFSNLDGTQDSVYIITLRSKTGATISTSQIQMPRANTQLENLVDVLPITPEYSTAAALSAAQAAASAASASDDADQTALDRIATGEDAAQTAADRIVTDEARDEAVESALRINTLFWLGV
jgi:hypothetical protein